MKKKVLACMLAAAMAVGMAACGAAPESGAAAPAGDADAVSVAAEETADEVEEAPEATEDKGVIRVASKSFSESKILAELYALALEDAGYTVERVSDVNDSLLHEALLEDEIDIYPEYTGTALLTILGQEKESDPEVVYETVKEMYAEDYQLAVLDMCAASDGEGMAMLADVADEYGITTVSDLQANAENIRMGSNSDFFEREDGLEGLEALYGPFNFKEETSFDNSLKYEIMANGEVDCVLAYTTDAKLADPMFVLLEDDLGFWPPYNIIPVVRQNVVDADPEVAEVINAISAAIDTDIMQGLNSKVDIDLEEVEDVAAEFYASIQ